MYNGIGLPTPRGSGTNGYVQRNVANVSLHGPSRRIGYQVANKTVDETLERESVVRKPDPDILEHERCRKAVVLSLELEEKLRNENILNEEQIKELVSKVRTQLMNQSQVDLAVDKGESINHLLQNIAEEAQKWKKASLKESKDKRRGLQVGFAREEPTLGLQLESRPTFRDYDTHRKSLAKEKENLKLKYALGLDDDYQPGDVFRNSRTEEEPVTQQTPIRPFMNQEELKLANEVEEEHYSPALNTMKEEGELRGEDEVAFVSPSRNSIKANKDIETDSKERRKEVESHRRRRRHHSTSRRKRSSSRDRRRHQTSSDEDRRRKRRHRHSSRRESHK
ncbi:Serine/arginine repetitive matrix protein 2 [Galdieria sulphuraria]|uniref:CWF21 domain-containing protein n=1 Tax=Galdieria sulphuraria TaxID=130081 RepID=M2XS48_GALSU|nr:uncharacterized protein Gasu_58910 [Galdieria sulphuraria]EME26488.1 hypothetical protein Gasu_58910 [Galdieria sulphuraria]GJD10016.1 Serine/arginine repetitive matrix protein 2 [Galdieria sulphuraria]|eukprot:XP_005703008.1 hypothetical protein Gasu_58910 [Galdieria sulphuraria]